MEVGSLFMVVVGVLQGSFREASGKMNEGLIFPGFLAFALLGPTMPEGASDTCTALSFWTAH